MPNTTNYFNPDSYKPNSQGMLFQNGYDYQMDRQRHDQMAQLQRAMIAYDMAKQHEELTQGHSQRQAERGANTAKFGLQEMLDRNKMSNPDYASAMTRGAIGEAGTKEATGRFDLGTVDTRIGSANASNRTKTLEDQAREFEIRASSSPLENEMEYQKFRQGAPDWIQLPERYSPEVPKQLKRISDIITQNPSHRRDIDKERVKGQLDIDKQREANKGVAMRGQQKALTYDQALKKAATSIHVGSITQQILNDPDIPDDQKPGLMARAKAAYDTMSRMEAARADARSPGVRDSIDGNVGNNIARRLNPGQQPSQGQSHTMADLRRMYPGKTDQWLRDAYKRRFGRDPQ